MHDVLFLVQLGQRDRRSRRTQRHINGQEVAPRPESIVLLVRHVLVYDRDTDQAVPLVEGLYGQPRRYLADAGIDKLAGLDVAPAEAEGDLGGRVEVREHVGDDVHLDDALHEDFAFVLAPFSVGEVAVDGAVHVPCNGFPHISTTYRHLEA